MLTFFCLITPALAQEGSYGRLWADQVFGHRQDSPGKKAKIFLVAFSSQNANFAQEILDQRALWKDAGFQDEEIACYYVRPVQEEFEVDKKQFLKIAPQLKDCFPAEVGRLWKDLKKSAKGKNDFLYLYLSSHGQEPFNLKLKKTDPRSKAYARYRRLAQYPLFNEYHVTVESLEEGPAHFFELLGAYRSGVAPEEIFITPKILKNFLKKNFSKTPKFIVLQGCYSGGFIEDPRKEKSKQLLSSLKNITVLTAARYDRESFGCQPGARSTYYGNAFNKVFSRYANSPELIPWKTLHEQVKKEVRRIEREGNMPGDSQPQFHSTTQESN